MVKNTFAIQTTYETQAPSLVWEDLLEEGIWQLTSVFSCLQNPMDGGAWQVGVRRVTKSQTRLNRLNMHKFSETGEKNIFYFFNLSHFLDNCVSVLVVAMTFF